MDTATEPRHAPSYRHVIDAECWCIRVVEHFESGWTFTMHGDALGRALSLHPRIIAGAELPGRKWGVYHVGRDRRAVPLWDGCA